MRARLTDAHYVAFPFPAVESSIIVIFDTLITDFSLSIQAVIESAKDNIIDSVTALADTLDLIDTKYEANGFRTG